LRRKEIRIPPLTESPFPHVVVPKFLEARALQPLVETLVEQQYDLQEADLHCYYSTGDLAGIDQPVFRMLKKAMEDETWLTRVAEAFETEPLADLEMNSRIFSLTDHYLPHNDNVLDRSVGFYLHLSPAPKSEDGGALELFSCNDRNLPVSVTRTLSPVYNSLVLYRVSATSWHQITELVVDRKRLTIAGWYSA